ncbi:hypothetical protein AOLI_G00264180 [Acnodon oligacanthus]
MAHNHAPYCRRSGFAKAQMSHHTADSCISQLVPRGLAMFAFPCDFTGVSTLRGEFWSMHAGQYSVHIQKRDTLQQQYLITSAQITT